MARPKAQPQQPQPAEKVEVVHTPEDVFPDLTENPTPEDDDQKVFDTATEEFNEHVKSLVRLFFEHETAELQQRVVDLELLTADLLSRLHHGNQQIDIPVQTANSSSYYPGSDIPEFKQEHQGGDGAPWYRS